jgi:hypothetical protein
MRTFTYVILCSTTSGKARRPLSLFAISILQFLVTGDKSAFFQKHQKKVCVDPGQIPKGIPKDVHCKKAMWCVWWDQFGIIHWEIMANGLVGFAIGGMTMVYNQNFRLF